jgi:hypothetical protein
MVPLGVKYLMGMLNKIAIFWAVMPCIWYRGTNVLKELNASIFREEGKNNRFPQDVGTHVSVCHIIGHIFVQIRTCRVLITSQ